MSDQNTPSLFRLRVQYQKSGRLAYLGHLELIHTIERIVRRAGLPYAVTQGFSPHMRIGFSSALPVGTSSTCEWYDLFLTELVPLMEAFDRLKSASPADLAPLSAGYINVRTPALTAQITRCDYLLTLNASEDFSGCLTRLEPCLNAVRALGSLPYQRGKKEKTIDLDRTLLAYDVVDLSSDGSCARIKLHTACDNDGALRPEILLVALDRALCGNEILERPIVSTGIQDLVSIESYRVERTAQMVIDSEGNLEEPVSGASYEHLV